ncbi:unnamed protein product [Ilex paraguariensis]|uniref:DUF674 domain-containing protein n=1 Tax=Ilex paraguariensis TaxID=185542 RepID=A0ABC8UC91_9AQUA
MATSKVTLKLLIDTQSHKVLFAEAGKEFVDFLFTLLFLPVGTVIKLLTKQSMVGSIGNLYDSIENLSEIYMQPNQDKNSLLNPQTFAAKASILLLDVVPVAQNKKFYRCSNYSCTHFSITDVPRIACPSCHYSMSSEVSFVGRAVAKDKKEAASDQGGYVKGVVTYMVADDLVVQPMSTISCITLLNKFNVKEVGALEERVVDLGMTEGSKLLKASLQSKSVLTSVFLGDTVT